MSMKKDIINTGADINEISFHPEPDIYKDK